MKDLLTIPFFKNINQEHIFDPLTGVLSREVFFDYAKSLVKENKPFTLFFSDIDNFKFVNDREGHSMGDKVLKAIANKISESFPQGVVARFGGDEFLFLMEDIVDYDQVWSIARYVRSEVDKMKFDFLRFDTIENKVTLTLGIARFPLDGETLDSIVERSDKALYRGKSKGRNCFIVYNHELHSQINVRDRMNSLNIENMLDYMFNVFSDSTLTFDESFKKVCKNMEDFYGVHRICISHKNQIIFNVQNEKIGEVKYIPHELYDNLAYERPRVLVLNNRTHLKNSSEVLYNHIMDQDIRSCIACKCETKNKEYGYLRVEMAHEHVWTQLEKVIFLTLAKLYTLFMAHKKD